MSWRDYVNADGVAEFRFDALDDFSSWRFEDGDEAGAARAGVALLGAGWAGGDVRTVEDGRRLADALRRWAGARLAEARTAADDGQALALFRSADEAETLADDVAVSEWGEADDANIAAECWVEQVRDALRSWGDEFPAALADSWDGWADGAELVARFERWLGDAGDRMSVTLAAGRCWTSCNGRSAEFEAVRPATADEAEIVARLRDDAEDGETLTPEETVEAARLLCAEGVTR
jgi:hypothetical protein